jgi:hypothetical protein
VLAILRQLSFVLQALIAFGSEAGLSVVIELGGCSLIVLQALRRKR